MGGGGGVNRRAVLGLGLGLAARAGRAADAPGRTLRLAVSAAPASLDPHYYTDRKSTRLNSSH